MKRMLTLFLLVTAVFIAATPAMAQEGSTPVQLALVNPVQIFSEKYAVSGLRINLLYGKNAKMTGLDWGLANHTTGDFAGIGVGAVNIVGGNAVGIQWSWVNLTTGDMAGLQYGIYNSAGQMGGLQLGWVNVAGEMKGVQLGLINVIKKGGLLPVFPIINAGF